MKGKLVHVLYSGGVGGLESACYVLARHLATLGIQQKVIFLDDSPGPGRDRLAALRGVTVEDCPYDKRHRWRWVRRLARSFDRTDKGVLIYMFGLHAFVAAAARMGGVRRVVTLIGNPPPDDTRMQRISMAAAQAGRVLGQGEVACSGYVRDAVVGAYHLPRRRVTVIHNWVDSDGIKAAVAGSSVDREAHPTVGMTARLDPIKDHRTLIDAFSLVLKTVPLAQLYLIGDGVLRKDLERSVTSLGLQDSIHFVGSVDDPVRRLAALDVFAFSTTDQEGFGIAMVEAMAAGVPVVATEVGPCREVLDEGTAGLLARPRDPADLASGIVSLLRDGTLRERLIQRAAVLVEERYDVKVAAERIMRLLDA